MTRRQYATVLIGALAARLIMLVWAHAGQGLAPHHGMYMRDFNRGYGIAAGYGYVDGDTELTRLLEDLTHRVESGGPPLTPATVPSLPERGVRPDMLHPPGLSVLVAVAHRLTGGPADRPIEILGLLLDVAASALAAWAAGSVLGPKIGLMAGLAYAWFPPLAYWSTVSKSADGLVSPFVVASLCAALKGFRSESRRRTILWHLLSGAAVGLGSWIRPDYLLMPIAMGIALGIIARRPAPGLRALVLVQTAALVVMLPWAARNHRLCGRWIFTSSGAGAVMILGLGEFENPWGFGPFDADRDREAAAVGLPDPWGPDADLYFRDLFRRSVAEKPLAWIKAILLRVPMAVATPFTWGYENPRKTETFSVARERGEDRYSAFRNRPWYILAAYWDRILMAGIMLMAACSSALLLWREGMRRPESILLLIPHLYGIGSHLLTHLEPRYLLPSVFCWLTGLAYLLGRGWLVSPIPE
jgi:4-amino-4-deoxy-L-arabinose transferase-like glycosyltransferase